MNTIIMDSKDVVFKNIDCYEGVIKCFDIIYEGYVNPLDIATIIYNEKTYKCEVSETMHELGSGKTEAKLLIKEEEMNKTDKLKKLLNSMSLKEAKEAGISEETYGKLTEKEVLMLKPKLGDRYYFLADWGKAKQTHWGNDDFDNYRYQTGNVYKTEEQAEKAKKMMLDKSIFHQINNWIVCNTEHTNWEWDLNQHYITLETGIDISTRDKLIELAENI